MEGKPARTIAHEERGQFLLDYMHLLLAESVNEEEGFRHVAGRPTGEQANRPTAVGRERWVINKIRALCSWYTKGFEGGAQFRIGVNSAKSISELQDLVEEFFLLARSPLARWPTMLPEIEIAGRDRPRASAACYAEIGINHEGSPPSPWR
jgi:hypothetical protein